MLPETLEAIKLRKNFYRDCYYRALRFLLFTCVTVIILLGLLIFFAANKPEPSYYATSDAGKVTQLTPMNQPNYSSVPLIA